MGRGIIVDVPRMVHGIWRGSLTILVALNNRDHPSDEEWEAYCDAAAELLRDPAGTARLRALAISDGGGPTSRQRTRVIEVAAGRTPPWALISESRFALGIGTALSWAVGGFRAFAPRELRQALRYLGLPPEEAPGLLRTIHELDRQLELAAVARLEQADLLLE